MARETIYKLGLEGEQYIAAAKKIQSEIDSLTSRQKTLSKTNRKATDEYVTNTAALKDNKTQLNFLTKQITQNNAQQQKTASVTKEVNTELGKEAKTINELENQNKKLLKIKKDLILTNDKEAKLAKEIDARLNKNNQTLSENSDAYTAQKRNIGNYASALDSLDPRLSGVVRQGQAIVGGLKAQKAAMVATTSATSLSSKALKIFKIALISTGIGALVVALGSLVAFLAKTQSGMDKVSVVMKAVGSVVDVLVDRFAKVGEILTNLFSQNFFTTLTQVKGSFEGIGDEIQREIDLTVQLELATQRLRDVEISQIGVQAQRRKMIEENRFAAKDELLSIDDRVRHLKLAQELERANLAEQLENAKERARISQADTDRANSTADEIRENAEIQAEVTNLETQSLKQQRTLEAELQSLQKRGRTAAAAQSKARAVEKEKEIAADTKYWEGEADKTIKRDDDELKRITDFNARKKELENEIALQNAASDEEREALALEQQLEKDIAEIERLNLSEEEKTQLLVLLEENRGDLLQAIRDKYDKKEFEATVKANQKIVAADKEQADARANVASTLTGILIGLLGDSLGAKLASVAIEAAVQAGLVAIESSSAQARNLAQATAAAPPPLNVPFIAAAGVQNIALAAQSKASIVKILTSAALQGFGTIVGSQFEDGGMLQGRSHDQGGIPFTIAGQGGFEAEGGEAIINKRSMANPFLRSLASQINVAGGGVQFANGGIVGVPSVSSNTLINYDLLAESLASKLNNIKVINVATETYEVAADVKYVENMANV